MKKKFFLLSLTTCIELTMLCERMSFLSCCLCSLSVIWIPLFSVPNVRRKQHNCGIFGQPCITVEVLASRGWGYVCQLNARPYPYSQKGSQTAMLDDCVHIEECWSWMLLRSFFESLSNDCYMKESTKLTNRIKSHLFVAAFSHSTARSQVNTRV